MGKKNYAQTTSKASTDHEQFYQCETAQSFAENISFALCEVVFHKSLSFLLRVSISFLVKKHCEILRRLSLFLVLRQNGAYEFDVPQFEVHFLAIAARSDEENKSSNLRIGSCLDHLGLPHHLRHGDAG